jgi:Flp pilus assembly protein TadD
MSLTDRAKVIDNFLELSLKLYREEKYTGCLEVCYKIIELDPNNATAYNNICSAFNELEEWEKAKSACEKALHIDPNFALARNNLSVALYNLKKDPIK